MIAGGEPSLPCTKIRPDSRNMTFRPFSCCEEYLMRHGSASPYIIVGQFPTTSVGASGRAVYIYAIIMPGPRRPFVATCAVSTNCTQRLCCLYLTRCTPRTPFARVCRSAQLRCAHGYVLRCAAVEYVLTSGVGRRRTLSIITPSFRDLPPCGYRKKNPSPAERPGATRGRKEHRALSSFTVLFGA